MTKKRHFYSAIAGVTVLLIAAGLFAACDDPGPGENGPGLIEFTGVFFENRTFAYDGTVRSLVVEGAPAGTAITYTNNDQTQVGEYRVAALLRKDGYRTRNMSALLTIVEALCEDCGNESCTCEVPFVFVPKPWATEPVIKQVWFDDFSEGIRRDEWDAETSRWGLNNNGVSADNIFYTTDREKVEAFGGTGGGLVIMSSKGDFYPVLTQRRQGASLVGRRAFGPGLYEGRIKFAPVPGQCSAFWTFWSGNSRQSIAWSPNPEVLRATVRYSEIDIEMPEAGSTANLSASSWPYYNENWDFWREAMAVRDHTGPVPVSPYNDGRWHHFAIDWRNGGPGDRGQRFYYNGQLYAEHYTWIPHYTQRLIITNWFPDSVEWIGDPTYELVYMYVDWVRVTEYDDPVDQGATRTTPGGTARAGINIGNSPIPRSNYLANSTFSQNLTVQNTKNMNRTSWETTNAVRGTNSLIMSANGRASQVVRSQFKGFKFDLEVEAEVGTGSLNVFVDFLNGRLDQTVPPLTLIDSTSWHQDRLTFFPSDGRAKRTFSFTVPNHDNINTIRVVLETPGGSTATVYDVKLFMP